eukprot:3779837-Pyramimonas_sp.AAC.1
MLLQAARDDAGGRVHLDVLSLEVRLGIGEPAGATPGVSGVTPAGSGVTAAGGGFTPGVSGFTAAECGFTPAGG